MKAAREDQEIRRIHFIEKFQLQEIIWKRKKERKRFNYFSYSSNKKHKKPDSTKSGTAFHLIPKRTLSFPKSQDIAKVTEATAMMVGLETERVLQGLAIVESQCRGDERSLRPVVDYSIPNVAEKVVRIVLSYRDYVMRTVWKQY